MDTPHSLDPSFSVWLLSTLKTNKQNKTTKTFLVAKPACVHCSSSHCHAPPRAAWLYSSYPQQQHLPFLHLLLRLNKLTFLSPRLSQLQPSHPHVIHHNTQVPVCKAALQQVFPACSRGTFLQPLLEFLRFLSTHMSIPSRSLWAAALSGLWTTLLRQVRTLHSTSASLGRWFVSVLG